MASSSPLDPTPRINWESSPVSSTAVEGSADTTFNVVAEADGLYPVRLLWYEGGGGANVEFFSVVDTGKKILINDPDNADAIKAYRTADSAPYISRVAPAAGELSRTIEFDFVNGDLSVVKSSVKMKLNGEDAAVSTSSTDDGISVVYDHGDYLPAGTHTVELSYSESGGVDRVRNYSISVPKGRVDILMDKPKVTIEFDDLTGNSAAGAVGNPDAVHTSTGLNSVWLPCTPTGSAPLSVLTAPRIRI